MGIRHHDLRTFTRLDPTLQMQGREIAKAKNTTASSLPGRDFLLVEKNDRFMSDGGSEAQNRDKANRRDELYGQANS